jgi:hypothetical protein
MPWSIIFTVIWAGVKVFFGKSDKEKLGISETTAKQQAETLNKVEKANEIRDDLRTLNDATVHEQLYSRWRRPL